MKKVKQIVAFKGWIAKDDNDFRDIISSAWLYKVRPRRIKAGERFYYDCTDAQEIKYPEFPSADLKPILLDDLELPINSSKPHKVKVILEIEE